MHLQNKLFKKVLGSHVRIEGNQLHASSTADSNSEKDSDSKITRFVMFEGLYTLEQPTPDPQACPAS
jgi:hypothetical protein